MTILARFAPAYTLGMTVAALILTDPRSTAAPAALLALTRLIEAAWSGGAQPILVLGHTSNESLAPLARGTAATDIAAAAREAAELVGGTSAALFLPVTHAGIDPETITALIAAHGRTPNRTLTAAWNGTAGPILLKPIQQAMSASAHDTSGEALLIECGDEAAVTASDGRARLTYEAPPADTEAVDPWERRGGEEG
jgi:hypothetical protein